MDNKDFQQAMQALPEPPNDSHPPLWDYWRHDLWEKVTGHKYDPEGFAGWPCIYHTMRVDHWRGATDIEYQRLLESGDNRLLEACVMPDFGYPRDYHTGKYSANLIHQAHHLYQWMKFSGKDVKDMSSIFEFGGGYGAMALVVRRMGFSGRYYIYDLPEFALLQQYFLSNVGIKGVKWTTPDSKAWMSMSVDLFIACFSLSEVDDNLRETALELIKATNYLFLYSGRFVDYDNTKYFGETLVENLLGMTWHTQHADHLPDLNYYTFGKIRDV